MSKRKKKRSRKVAEPDARNSTSTTVWPDYLIAAGLAIVVFVRPWRDGASFQGFNAYFVWTTGALAAIWAARLLFRETSFRFVRLAAPLAAFIVIGAVTSYDSYLPDHTFRQLLYWTTSFFLLILAANTLHTPTARGVFYAAFAVTMTCSAAWALIHLQYVLPQVREIIEQNPSTRQYYFQTANLPPELAHRLSVNRAYGATLFPNALAAFMILALPFLVAELGAAMLEWRKRSENAVTQRAGWKSSLAVGAAIALVLGGSARVVFPLLYYSIASSPDWQSAGVLVALVVYVIPVAIGAAITLLLMLVGWKTTWLYVQMVFLPFAALVVALALFKTYSRGGMLALAVAGTAVAVLLAYRSKRLQPAAKAAAALLIALTALFAVGSHAQDAMLPSEGVDTDVLSPQSFMARLDYWHVGLSMIRDNPLTGVGLGAFGPAYAHYMFPGASVSQMAHNHFIQVFAETGVFGFVSIAAFWLTFILYAVRSLLNAPDLIASLRIAGPFCGVLAFVMHSLVDFNFANPSLAMTAFVFTGACCARAATVRTPVPLPQNVVRYASIVMLLVVAIATSAMIRIYAVDYALTGPLPTTRKLMVAGNRLEIRDKLHSATFYLDRLSSSAQNPQRVLYSGYEELLRIVPDHDRILRFGFLAQLDTSTGNRFTPVTESGGVPADAVVVITDVAKARNALFESADALLDDLESIDAPYPYIVEVSMHAYQWCDLVFTHATDTDTRRRFALLGETWARRSTERSPYQSGAWIAYGKALWQRATTEQDNQDAQRYYDQGLAAYRRAAEFFPVSPNAWASYATALEKLGQGYIEGGNRDKGYPMLEEAREVRKHVRELQQEWAAAGRR